MRAKIITFIIVILYMLLIAPHCSYCWIRDADIEKSKDSVSIGMMDYLSFAYAYEKRLDNNTSIGVRYLPYYFMTYQNYDITWNKQFYRDEGSSWVWFWGAYSPGYAGMHGICPIFGWAYKNKLSERWDFRFASLFILPYTLELDYLISDNLEFSFGYNLAGTISLRYLF